MNNTRKMVLRPYQDGGADADTNIEDVFTPSRSIETQTEKPKRGNSIRKYAADRQQKLLHIVLKLAAYGGYDEDGKIKTRHGEVMDIVPLLLYSSSPGRSVKGMADFVELLYNAGVSPDLVINVNVRDMLSDMFASRGDPKPKPRSRLVPKRISAQDVPLPDQQDMDEAQSNPGTKRKSDDVVDEKESNTKAPVWDKDESEDDELN